MIYSSEHLIIFLMGYIVLCIIAYIVQEYFIFKPEKLAQNFQFRYEEHFEELFFEMPDGARINGLLFYDLEETTRGLVIYFHGNTRSIKGWAKYAKDFYSHDYDVLMIDYRGFGKSTGKRQEDKMFSDSQEVYNQMLKRGYKEQFMIIYGRSLGSGFACQLASNNNPKCLILDAPYYNFSSLIKRFLPFLPISIILSYNLRTDEYIREVRCPVYIIHGTKDRLIPYRSSVKLANLSPQNIRLIPIYGGGHNNLPSFSEYHQRLEEILLDRFDLIFDKHIPIK